MPPWKFFVNLQAVEKRLNLYQWQSHVRINGKALPIKVEF